MKSASMQEQPVGQEEDPGLVLAKMRTCSVTFAARK